MKIGIHNICECHPLVYGIFLVNMDTNLRKGVGMNGTWRIEHIASKGLFNKRLLNILLSLSVTDFLLDSFTFQYARLHIYGYNRVYRGICHSPKSSKTFG